MRTCAGCGVKAPKPELVRFVLRDGTAVEDPAQREPGRGAYVHDDPGCRERANRRGGFARAFRARLTS
jgi:uncharacterized protein